MYQITTIGDVVAPSYRLNQMGDVFDDAAKAQDSRTYTWFGFGIVLGAIVGVGIAPYIRRKR